MKARIEANCRGRVEPQDRVRGGAARCSIMDENPVASGYRAVNNFTRGQETEQQT
jgi:hypothetical protein